MTGHRAIPCFASSVSSACFYSLNLAGGLRRLQAALASALFAGLLLAPGLSAQEELLGVQLLFEPVPIPQEGAPDSAAFTTLAAVTAGTGTSAASTELSAERRDELEATLADYLARVGTMEANEGPFSAELPQELLATGQLYQQLDQHDRALAFLARAQNVSRLNNSMNTLEQIPIMQAMVESHLALEQFTQADEIQDGLLYLHQQAYGDATVQVVPAMQALGDWNLRAFLERSNIALNINRMDVNNFMYGGNFAGTARNGADVGYVQSVNPTLTPLYKLYLAQGNFFNTINILLAKQDYTNPALLELERKLLTTLFLRTHQENIVYETDFYLDRKTTATGTRLDTSDIQFFTANPAMTAMITDLVYPATPVVLPTFLPAPNSREKLGIAADEDVTYFGYFDVSFSIQKNGRTRRVKILDKGGEVTSNMELRLNDYLKNLTFRPRYNDGELDTDTLELRYYVGY